MRKYIYLFILSLFILSSCEKITDIKFSQSDSFIAFENAKSSVSETDKTIKILVNCSDVNRQGDIGVVIDFDTIGFGTFGAVQGIDFEFVKKTIKFTEGKYVDTLIISIIDNDFYDKTKRLRFNLKTVSNPDYTLGKLGNNLADFTSIVVEISDDEHPLALILAAYRQANFKLADGSAAETNELTIGSIDGNDTTVVITNFWGGAKKIEAVVDINQNKIKILPGQVIYVSGQYGDCKAVAILDGKSLDPNIPIYGTFDNEGNISFTPWAAHVSAGNFGTYSLTTLTKK